MLALAIAALVAQQPGPCVDPFSFYGMRTYTENSEFSFLGTDWLLLIAPENYQEITFHLMKGGQEFHPHQLLFQEPPLAGVRKMEVQGPPKQIAEAGDYVAEFRLKDKAISKFPFSIKKTSGGDPFKPTVKWSYTTPIDRMGMLHADPEIDSRVYLSFMMHGDRDGFANGSPWHVKMFHNGKLVAESQERKITSLSNKPYDAFFMVKENGGRANELNYSEMMKMPGTLRFDVDVKGKKARSFTYTLSGGSIKPHPRSELSYQPATGYFPPRKPVQRVGQWEFHHAWWADSQ